MSVRSLIEAKVGSLEKGFEVYNNIYVSCSATLNNFDFFVRISPGHQLIPVLKGNAYGHGLKQITEILKARSFPYIAVDGYFEALRIHEISKQPVLVMGAIKPENFRSVKTKNYAYVLHDTKTLKAMSETSKKFKIHLELETGMGRHGIRLDELEDFLKQISKAKNLKLEGVMSHLADADNPESTKYLDLQTERFDKAVEIILKTGFKPTYIHLAQSAGSVKVHSKYANTLRVGISLYGVNPLEPNDKYANEFQALRPALQLNTTIAKVLELDKGESVSYGCTYVVKRRSRIGVLPLGYYEGVPRQLSNVGMVGWENEFLPIVGRVCMNHTMIDITDSKVGFGDQITVISSNPKNILSLNNISQSYNIYSYSLLVGLNQNIRRTIVE